MRRKVFIGSSAEALEIAYVVQENLEREFECTVWTQDIFRPSEYTLDSLEELLDTFEYGIFIFSPDDELTIRDTTVSVVRDNVLFELGLFIGRLGRHNAFFIAPRGDNNLHLPSDLMGVTFLNYDGARSDGNQNAALGPACNKVAKEIRRRDSQIVEDARLQYDLLNNKYPLRRSIRYLDTACVFDSRTSFDQCIGVQRILTNAKSVKAIGISLNAILLNWGTNNLVKLIQQTDCHFQLLFLDPDCAATEMREKDENLPAGTIAQVTRTNINLVDKARFRLDDKRDNICYRLYDKVPSINMYIIDDSIIILQHYLSGLRGQEAPVYVIRDEGNDTGLFFSYNEAFENIWREASRDEE